MGGACGGRGGALAASWGALRGARAPHRAAPGRWGVAGGLLLLVVRAPSLARAAWAGVGWPAGRCRAPWRRVNFPIYQPVGLLLAL